MAKEKGKPTPIWGIIMHTCQVCIEKKVSTKNEVQGWLAAGHITKGEFFKLFPEPANEDV
jgi:hypothetical protein